MLLEFGENGIYCPAGDFYIDPWRPVQHAVITHAHADHARKGHAFYLAHEDSAGILRHRLGQDIALRTVAYGQSLYRQGVEVSLWPAGHVPGSAQVRVAYKGEVWVVSGDYKVEADGISTPFEPVRCHTFVTESTFGMPIYRWQPQASIFEDIHQWWKANQAAGKSSVIFAYALGKAQRLLAGLDPQVGPVYVHGAIAHTLDAMTHALRLPFEPLRVTAKPLSGALVIAPPSVLGSPWLKRFEPVATAMASGWMSVRGIRRRRAMDNGFALSDHADWPGLLQAIEATQCQRVFVTHGYTHAFSRHLREHQGLESYAVQTRFEGEEPVNQEDATTD